MRIAAVYSISPIRLDFKKREISSYERGRLDQLFRELVSKGLLSSAYTFYSQALRELESGNVVGFRNVLRRMMEILKERDERKTEFELSSSDRITLVDRSSDIDVSFKAPASVPVYSSYIFITSHEGEHARKILRKALLEGKKVQVLVRIFYRYDSKGRLIAVGGLTTARVIESVREESFEAVA